MKLTRTHILIFLMIDVIIAAVVLGWFLLRGDAEGRTIARAPFPVQRCLNMGNALEAPVEGNWGYRIEAEHFGIIRAAGFDTVRIPIRWADHAAMDAPYTIKPEFFSRIDAVVSQGLAAGLNVIINVHHYEALYSDPDRHEARLAGLWAQIADRYAGQPPQLMFEIINEPRDAFSGARVNRTQDKILARIRQTNPTRTAILAGDEYGNLAGLKNLRVPDDPHVVATVHYYAPYEFTHQGASWLRNPPPLGRAWPLPGEADALADNVGTMVLWRQKNSVPLFLGEFGTDGAVPNKDRVAWSGDVRTALEAAGIPWCAYNFAGGFPMYDVASGRWNEPLLAAFGMSPGPAAPALRPRQDGE